MAGRWTAQTSEGRPRKPYVKTCEALVGRRASNAAGEAMGLHGRYPEGLTAPWRAIFGRNIKGLLWLPGHAWIVPILFIILDSGIYIIDNDWTLHRYQEMFKKKGRNWLWSHCRICIFVIHCSHICNSYCRTVLRCVDYLCDVYWAAGVWRKYFVGYYIAICMGVGDGGQLAEGSRAV